MGERHLFLKPSFLVIYFEVSYTFPVSGKGLAFWHFISVNENYNKLMVNIEDIFREGFKNKIKKMQAPEHCFPCAI